MSSFGLSESDLSFVQSKISNQISYLESQTFVTSTGQEKSLRDVSYGANVSYRYYPRILNKVNTFTSVNLARDYVPVFLTSTLDGFFRDFLVGDFSRFDDDVRAKYLDHIPNNDRFGYHLDSIDNKVSMTIKDLYKIHSFQFYNFLRSYTLQKIRKLGYDYSYIRVTEPHQDGVPHFHILLFIPPQFVHAVYLEFHKFFPAPQNSKPVTYLNSNRKGALVAGDDYETLGFQTQIRNASGYILKYILKSFRNLIEDKEIDYLQAWYILNRIPRLTSSHTLVAQDIYHNVSVLDDDWNYLTLIKLTSTFISDRDNNYFKFVDMYGRTIIGDSGYYCIYSSTGKLLSSYGTKKFSIPVYRLRDFTFSTVKPVTFSILARYRIYKSPLKYIYTKSILDSNFYEYSYDIHFDDNTSCSSDFTSFSFAHDIVDLVSNLVSTPIVKLSDLQLWEHYYNFDFDKFALPRFAFVHNEMISRGMLFSYPLSPNDINTDFEVFYES